MGKVSGFTLARRQDRRWVTPSARVCLTSLLRSYGSSILSLSLGRALEGRMIASRTILRELSWRDQMLARGTVTVRLSLVCQFQVNHRTVSTRM